MTEEPREAFPGGQVEGLGDAGVAKASSSRDDSSSRLPDYRWPSQPPGPPKRVRPVQERSYEPGIVRDHDLC